MVVEAKDSYDVMLLPGDGIGPEITAATVNALEPLQSLFKLNFKEVCCRRAGLKTVPDMTLISAMFGSCGRKTPIKLVQLRMLSAAAGGAHDLKLDTPLFQA